MISENMAPILAHRVILNIIQKYFCSVHYETPCTRYFIIILTAKKWKKDPMRSLSSSLAVYKLPLENANSMSTPLSV